MEFRHIAALKAPRRVTDLVPEAQAVKAFKVRATKQETSRVVALAFSPVAPYQLAVASGTKVGLWRVSPTGELQGDVTLTKFKDLTQCVAWRSDGKLLLAGEASGSCAVIDVAAKKVLRRLRGHGDAVTCASFAAQDKTRAATGGRDGRLRIWDVTTSELLRTVDAHTDCLKVLAPGVGGGSDSWVTAGYDGKLRLWDLRAPEGDAGACVATVDHGHPVEAGCTFPGGSMFATVGGPAVRMWDLSAGGRLVQELPEAHSKSVTAVCLDSGASTLLTVSYDGIAKAHSVASFDHLFSFTLKGPATCAAWRADDRAFTVGLEDGTWQLRLRKTEEDEERRREAAAQAVLAARSRAKKVGHLRGPEVAPGPDDEVVETHERPGKKRRSEAQVDYFFRKFEHDKVLEYALEPSTSMDAALGIFDELLQRGALPKVLEGRDEASCLQIIKYLMKAFGGDSPHQALILEVLHSLLEANQCLQLPLAPALAGALGELDKKVVQEMRVQEALVETMGVLKAVTCL